MDNEFGFGEIGEEDDDNNDEDIYDDQSMICALIKEIADIKSGHGEELSDVDKKAVSKLGAQKKLEMSQKDLHGESTSHINWEENAEDEKSLKLKITKLRKKKSRMMTMTMTWDKMMKMRKMNMTACIWIRTTLQ